MNAKYEHNILGFKASDKAFASLMRLKHTERQAIKTFAHICAMEEWSNLSVCIWPEEEECYCFKLSHKTPLGLEFILHVHVKVNQRISLKELQTALYDQYWRFDPDFYSGLQIIAKYSSDKSSSEIFDNYSNGELVDDSYNIERLIESLYLKINDLDSD